VSPEHCSASQGTAQKMTAVLEAYSHFSGPLFGCKNQVPSACSRNMSPKIDSKAEKPCRTTSEYAACFGDTKFFPEYNGGIPGVLKVFHRHAEVPGKLRAAAGVLDRIVGRDLGALRPWSSCRLSSVSGARSFIPNVCSSPRSTNCWMMPAC